MLPVQVGGHPDDVNGRVRHVLFVEGSSQEVDSIAIGTLLRNMIRIEAMGPSFHLKSVATALYPSHPNYYFLIDRDHHDDIVVNSSWNNFPDSATSNLLIWKKKEFENYFLDPEYLQESDLLKPLYRGSSGIKKLEEKITCFANQRVYMEVVNRVILIIREEQKDNWINVFTNLSNFGTPQEAVKALTDMQEFALRRRQIDNSVSNDRINELFNDVLNFFSGNSIPLKFGVGEWCARMSGKEILRQIVNSCFQVTDREGLQLQGEEKYIEAINDLVKKKMSDQPSDFQELYSLIKDRIDNS
ncbi:hypothetical protein [Candidatus Magnetaquicoccus inordinatus]|uniref:hypothetical protein n=1 Tax=Candidatus Magnetaquicoccus inordinatus TaxID=2496818 RepID=UPI00102B11AA|nr:hypothetical protein [Candidatus Magnetaquicoccus inordinatus]